MSLTHMNPISASTPTNPNPKPHKPRLLSECSSFWFPGDPGSRTRSSARVRGFGFRAQGGLFGFRAYRLLGSRCGAHIGGFEQKQNSGFPPVSHSPLCRKLQCPPNLPSGECMFGVQSAPSSGGSRHYMILGLSGAFKAFEKNISK